MLFAAAAPASSAVETTLAPENEKTGSISPSWRHDLVVAKVKAGLETVSFSARLTEQSTRYAKNVAWQLYDAEGARIFDATATTVDLPLKPGDYKVEARLGAVVLQEGFSLRDGDALAFNFVLNAGALRVLPRLAGSLPQDVSSRSRIYALTGADKGRLIVQTATPGEMLTLAAGRYRVETRLGLGNAISIADVTVKPGVVSAMSVDHHAGLAHLAFEGPAASGVEWRLLQGDALLVTNVKGALASLVLLPGEYTAQATVNGVTHARNFSVTDGETSFVTLRQ